MGNKQQGPHVASGSEASCCHKHHHLVQDRGGGVCCSHQYFAGQHAMHMLIQSHDAVHHKPAINSMSLCLASGCSWGHIACMPLALLCATGYLFSLQHSDTGYVHSTPRSSSILSGAIMGNCHHVSQSGMLLAPGSR